MLRKLIREKKNDSLKEIVGDLERVVNSMRGVQRLEVIEYIRDKMSQMENEQLKYYVCRYRGKGFYVNSSYVSPKDFLAMNPGARILEIHDNFESACQALRMYNK